MPPPLAIDREQVRMLVLSIGVRPAARQLGLSEETVAAWSARGDWLAPISSPKPASMVSTSVASISPADALAQVMAEKKIETKVGLAKWSATSSTHLATLEGEEACAAAPAAKLTADVMAKVWPEVGGVSMRVSLAAHGQAIDVEGEYVPDP